MGEMAGETGTARTVGLDICCMGQRTEEPFLARPGLCLVVGDKLDGAVGDGEELPRDRAPPQRLERREATTTQEEEGGVMGYSVFQSCVGQHERHVGVMPDAGRKGRGGGGGGRWNRVGRTCQDALLACNGHEGLANAGVLGHRRSSARRGPSRDGLHLHLEPDLEHVERANHEARHAAADCAGDGAKGGVVGPLAASLLGGSHAPHAAESALGRSSS